MNPRKALDRLVTLSPILEHVPYEEIVAIMKESIVKIPIPVAKLKADTFIDRARKNIGETLFSDVHDNLSYIKDPHFIANLLTDYGRANKPHQAMFYGAIESTLIDAQRITAIAETSELFRNRNGVSYDGELYTISRWKNNSELNLAEIVFAQKAIDTNPDIKRAFEKQTEFAKQLGTPDIGFYQDFLIFISEEFAREPKTNNDYKIANAYAELVSSKADIHGIAYPSVATGFFGQNVVFPPAVVDQYLTIEVLATQRLYKDRMNMILVNHKNCENPQHCANAIVWTDVFTQTPIDAIHAELKKPQPLL
jgi:hypothetical protein